MEDNSENENNYNYSPSVRHLAVNILNRYDRSDSYIDKLLNHELKRERLIHQDRALLTELVNGVVRWRGKIDWILTGFYHGDYQKCLNLVKNAMRIALYQMLFLNRIPIPAAIYESVEVVKRIQGDKTASIVNGVLRNIARNIENIRYPNVSEDETYYYAVIYSHPKWLVKKWIDRFGLEDTLKLMKFNNRRPYTAVRVVSTNASISEIEEIFNNHNIKYTISPHNPNSILLESPRYNLSDSDIFKTGKITIQDPSSSLSAILANPKEGDTILDICAAPGGKSFLLAELMNNKGRVIAFDKHESKLRFIKNGAERLKLDIIKTDVNNAEQLNFTEKVDIIFADVPCSGLGTLSKKPDIKWKKEPEDISKLVSKQREILESASKVLKPGGVLVYSTCSIEPEENEENIEWFLKNHKDFELDNAEKYLPESLCKDGYYYSIPHLSGMDGAFAARLIKK